MTIPSMPEVLIWNNSSLQPATSLEYLTLSVSKYQQNVMKCAHAIVQWVTLHYELF